MGHDDNGDTNHSRDTWNNLEESGTETGGTEDLMKNGIVTIMYLWFTKYWINERQDKFIFTDRHI